MTALKRRIRLILIIASLLKMKKAPVMILFILSFVCAMAMGYMSSQDSTQSWVNWVEQSINTVSQLCLMLGVIALHKAGLKDWSWEGKAV